VTACPAFLLPERSPPHLRHLSREPDVSIAQPELRFRINPALCLHNLSITDSHNSVMPNATATNQSISADSSNTPVAGVLGEEEITSPPRGGRRKKMLSFEAKADFFVIDSTAATTPQLTSAEEDSDMKKTAEGSNLVVLALAAEMVAMTAKRLADKKSPPTANKRKRAPLKKQPAKSIDWKKYRKVCSAPNCTNQANRKGGVCKRHGRLCSSPNCTNTIVNRGVCMKHGAIIKRCNTDGCDNFAI